MKRPPGGASSARAIGLRSFCTFPLTSFRSPSASRRRPARKDACTARTAPTSVAASPALFERESTAWRASHATPGGRGTPAYIVVMERTHALKLAPHLTLENREDILKRAAHKSRREIEELVAELSPRPDAPAVMRKLPDRRDGTTSPAPRPGPDGEAPSHALRPQGGASVDRQLRPDGVVAREPELRPDGVAVLPASARTRPAVVEPLAPGRYKTCHRRGSDADSSERARSDAASARSAPMPQADDELLHRSFVSPGNEESADRRIPRDPTHRSPSE